MAKFDSKAYIDAHRLREGQDAYETNKFNQKASDDLPLDRDIPDVRNSR